jgi:hypothetical protein
MCTCRQLPTLADGELAARADWLANLLLPLSTEFGNSAAEEVEKEENVDDTR